MRAKWDQKRPGIARAGMLAVLCILACLPQITHAREVLRDADLPRGFKGWAAARADDAVLSATAMGLPATSLQSGADFCLGAVLDTGMAQGLSGGLPLHALSYCPHGLAALRGGETTPAIRLVGVDRPLPNTPPVPPTTPTMCTPVLRNR